MDLPRSSGVLLHPTSLPAGRLGPEAYAFAEWLAAAGQSWWQVLPLGPPDEHGSPYKAASAFACSPALLAEPDAPVSADERAAFREREAAWIADWESFCLGASGGDEELRAPVRVHTADAAVDAQVRFEREWAALREHCAGLGVRLIGDVPIYVAPAGADHVAHPAMFVDGLVAGAPPDAFTELGQLWGNPVYDWPRLRRTGYAWWTERLRRTADLFDLSRIDHFRGFVAYWAVPADAADARSGTWRRGPGRAPFDAARPALGGELPFIAEDLGVITPPVERLRDDLGLPGMVVLQFGFDPDDPTSPHHPDRHLADRLAYTGTHDNDTIRGWYEGIDDATRARVDAAVAERGLDDPEPWWRLVRLTLSSPARIAVVQAQDVLGLGPEARMNVPGSKGSSWRWRVEPGALTGDLAARLRAATEEAGRLAIR
jgi:4-alpha-glucanotransferase